MPNFLHRFNSSGFTVIELLLVISIIAILAASTTPFLSQFLLRSTHSTASDRIVGMLRKAQLYSMNSKLGETWGICQPNAATLRLFAGSCDSPTVNEEFTLASSLSFSLPATITFNIRGEPSTTLSTSLTSSLDSTTFVMNSAGGIDIN